ncbi:MAG: 2-C-methyl-D-erythritol 4-phosphate cytidylyltransferase [Pseudomonadota bacterium]
MSDPAKQRTPASNVLALVVAAGRGSRMGTAAGGQAKQYAALDDLTVLAHAIGRLLKSPQISAVQVVIHPDDGARFRGCLSSLGKPGERVLAPVHGGATRQASTHNGLRALQTARPDVVLIHDAARPFLSVAVIDRVLEACELADGAVPALPAIDTMKRVDQDGGIVETIQRDTLVRAQTPQAFKYEALLQAHDTAAMSTPERQAAFTDDASIMEANGRRIVVVEGDEQLRKITTPEDLAWARRHIQLADAQQESSR